MSVTDKAKLWAATIIFLVVVYVAAYADMSGAARFGASVTGVVAIALLIFFSQAGRVFAVFVRDAGAELRKVVWPTKQETLQMVGIVFLFVAVTTTFVWFVDFLAGLVLNQLIK